jgi:nucleoside-diphosphate-sugar epimerase
LRILLTGSSGYIGAVLAPRLEKAGHDVVGLDLGLYEESSFSAGTPKPDRRDLRELTPNDVEGFDAVICLAALSNDPIGDLDKDLTYGINHRATVGLAKLAKDAGVERFLFASSCSLYGASGGSFVDENGSFAPITAYGRSKVLVEEELAALADDSFSPTYLRNATVYGVSPALRLDVVVNNLTAWAVATGRIVLISDGTPWRPQVHVEDVCLAFEAVLAAQREIVHNEAFNVGSTDENFQVRDIAAMVGERFPEADLVVPESSGPDTRSYRVDFSKAESLLDGFDPKWTVRAGVDQLATAFEAVDMVEADFGRYTRLAEVQRRIALGQLDNSLRWI